MTITVTHDLSTGLRGHYCAIRAPSIYHVGAVLEYRHISGASVKAPRDLFRAQTSDMPLFGLICTLSDCR